MPRIYAACLASYNAGILHGAWIDVAICDYSTKLEDDIVAMQGDDGAWTRRDPA